MSGSQSHYMVLEYGESGMGKTVDLGLAFPDALCLGNPRATQSLEFFGIRLRVIDPGRLRDVPALLQKERPKALLFDDVSLSAKRDVRNSSDSSWHLWANIEKDLMRALDAADSLGIPVGINAHQKEPFTDDKGVYFKGGPQLPGKQLPKTVPANCDVVGRVISVPERPGWPFGLHTSQITNPGGTDLDSSSGSPYTVKTRLARTPPIAPLNMAEILRHHGRSVPRLKGMDWVEGVVEKLAEALRKLDGDGRARLLQSQVPKAVVKYNATPEQTRWLLRDAIDRADLRNATSGGPLAEFGLSV